MTRAILLSALFKKAFSTPGFSVNPQCKNTEREERLCGVSVSVSQRRRGVLYYVTQSSSRMQPEKWRETEFCEIATTTSQPQPHARRVTQDDEKSEGK